MSSSSRNRDGRSARSSASEERVDGARSDGIKTGSRRVTAVACVACQRRKGKCDGQRPTCSACLARNVNCYYETADGLTRGADLRQKNQMLTSRLLDLERFVAKLRSPDELEATAAFAAFRNGQDIRDIVGAQDGEIFQLVANSSTSKNFQQPQPQPQPQHFDRSDLDGFNPPYTDGYSMPDGQDGYHPGPFDGYQFHPGNR